MTIKVAINGFGRIGRNVLRAWFEGQYPSIQVVAINDPSVIETNAHLLQYDTVHGRFNQTVSVDGDYLLVGDQRIFISQQRDPAQCPWADLDIDIVFECTGLFRSREKAGLHLQAGAKKVLISAPSSGEVDATVVYGVNHHVLRASDQVVSNASCTTNCLAPVAQVLDEAFGIDHGMMVTIHAYTNDQSLTDNSHSDLRRARSATHSMIPTSTGAAAAVGLVLPQLAGRLDGYAMRVPVINVSVVDLTFTVKRETSVDEINQTIRSAASERLKGVMSYNDLPLVSIDYNHNPHSSNFDATQTRQVGQMFKIVSWYDNEWGFSHRMLDTAAAMMEAHA